MGREGCGMTPLAGKRGARLRRIEGLVRELTEEVDKARQEAQQLALVAALRSGARKRSPGRPKRYSDDDMAALDEWLPVIAKAPAYRHWLACRDEEDSDTGRLRYLLTRIKWPKAGGKPGAEALRKALARWRTKSAP
jgi:hypothetical protein